MRTLLLCITLLIGIAYQIAAQEPAQERRTLAIKLLREALSEANDDKERYAVLRSLARLDPAGAMTALNERPLIDGGTPDFIRFEAARALAATSIDDALEIAASTSTDHIPTMTTVRVALALPADERPRKLAILAEAQLKAQLIPDTGFRVLSLAMVADALYRLGEKERAAKLLLDQLETARTVVVTNYDAYIRGNFAEKLARSDLAAALSLVEAIVDYYEKTRHLGNIAHQIAGDDPAEAERILGLMPPPPRPDLTDSQYDRYAQRVCYRMAKVNLPRALRIAEGASHPHQRALSLGSIGVAIGGTDNAQAAALFRRAFDELEQPGQRGLAGQALGSIGGWLVYHAHAIDRELATELRARLLKLLPSQFSGERLARRQENDALATAASFVALVDPTTARELLERLDIEIDMRALSAGARTWLATWAIIDPQEAIKRMPARLSPTFKARYVAPAIAASGSERLRLVHENAGLWQIDTTEDDF